MGLLNVLRSTCIIFEIGFIVSPGVAVMVKSHWVVKSSALRVLTFRCNSPELSVFRCCIPNYNICLFSQFPHSTSRHNVNGTWDHFLSTCTFPKDLIPCALRLSLHFSKASYNSLACGSFHSALTIYNLASYRWP